MNGAVFLIHFANALPQKASHIEQREKCFPRVAFVFYPRHFSEKKNQRKLVMWALETIIFLAMDCGFH